MAITYPLSLPSNVSSRNIRFGYEKTVGLTQSPFTRKTQVVEFDGDMWTVDFDLPLMDDETASEWTAFLMALKGQRGTFLLGHPTKTTPRGTGAGTPLVNGASQTGANLVTDGWGTSQVVLKKGDFFSLGQRLYSVLTDTTSDGSGNATLDIFPNLRESPANNAALTLTNPTGLFRLEDSSVELGVLDASKLTKLQFKAIEAL